MNYQQQTGKTIKEGFLAFNSENPHIYEAFEKQALRAVKNGRKKISAKLIINWIRWNEFLKSTDQNFKINDAFQSYYARYFVEQHPEHAELFSFRKLRNEESGPCMNVDENGQISFI